MKKNTTYRPAPTKPDNNTIENLIDDGVVAERATRGVGRNGRLVQVLHFDDATGKYVITDQDKAVEFWTAARVRKHFA